MIEQVEARSIARRGLEYGWPLSDCEDEIVERLGIHPMQARSIVLDMLREKQEHDVQQVHDEISFHDENSRQQ